ncbi:hypothetical protein H4Q26_012059 [Puccinia striiformis f. sp. tritici PST-130]|nr:hypothetical protein H4Q26_012059 [Puccinia striiformis f. sp. tritici PST-130]
MFSYAVKAVLFCSAVHLAGGSPLLWAQFQATITKLFRSWQVILQTGQEQYGMTGILDSNVSCRDLFTSSATHRRLTTTPFSTAVFQSLFACLRHHENHFASLNIDLAAFLRVTLLDLNLFLAVGIDINVLLGLNLSIGGF